MAKELYEFGPFRVDPEKETLFRAGESVPLTPKTFQILLVLIRNSNEVVTKDDIMKTVWPDTFVEEANLSRNVFMLRKALFTRFTSWATLLGHGLPRSLLVASASGPGVPPSWKARSPSSAASTYWISKPRAAAPARSSTANRPRQRKRKTC
jgi:hypothetical protein